MRHPIPSERVRKAGSGATIVRVKGRLVTILIIASVFTIVFLSRAPLGGCTERAEPGMDPSRWWLECETVLGYTITIDNNFTGSHGENRPVDPSYNQSIFLGVIAAAIAGGVSSLRTIDREPAYP
jgi:hypothetical protein